MRLSGKRISVRVDKQTYRRLAAVVKGSGHTVAELVREALAYYLEEIPHAETCLEIARRHNLIGCVKGLPPDLSTRKASFGW